MPGFDMVKRGWGQPPTAAKDFRHRGGARPSNQRFGTDWGGLPGLVAAAWLFAAGPSVAAPRSDADYPTDIQAAFQALAAGRPDEVLARLMPYVPARGSPDPRGFEWRYLWHQCQRQAPSNSANLARERDLIVGLPAAPAVTRLFILPSEAKLVTTWTNQMVALLDLQTLERVEEIVAAARPLYLRPDGCRLLTDGEGGLQIWDSRARALAPLWLAAPTGDWAGAAFLPTDWIAALPSPDGLIVLMDVGTVSPDKLIGQFQAHQGAIGALAFSPDGKLLASGGTDALVKLWNWHKPRALASLQGHQGSVTALAFSPDGKVLASGGADGTVRLWDVAGRRLRATLPGHPGPVRVLAFTPEGRTLASGGAEDQVRLWNVPTGQAVGALRFAEAGSQGVASLAFAPDGSVLAARAVGEALRVWRAPWPDRLTAAGPPPGQGQ